MPGKEANRFKRDAVDGGKGDERCPEGVEIVDAGASLADLARLDSAIVALPTTSKTASGLSGSEAVPADRGFFDIKPTLSAKANAKTFLMRLVRTSGCNRISALDSGKTNGQSLCAVYLCFSKTALKAGKSDSRN